MNHGLIEFEKYLQQWSEQFPWAENSKLPLSVQYSLLGGGKRFRPELAIRVFQSYQSNISHVLPWAAAVEMVHSYSLIHDDLPCMDDDNLRRGRPTNHIVFGEAIALLAGDTLLTESFSLLADEYGKASPQIAVSLISKLAQAAGGRGMVAGQVQDLSGQATFSREDLRVLHQLKTGKLIQVSVVGAALLAGATEQELHQWALFGDQLGFAFQLADDLLDIEQDKGHGRSWVEKEGLDGTRALLEKTSKEALMAIDAINKKTDLLVEVVQRNQERLL